MGSRKKKLSYVFRGSAIKVRGCNGRAIKLEGGDIGLNDTAINYRTFFAASLCVSFQRMLFF